MDATTRVLEQRFATYILLRIYQTPNMTKKEAVDEAGGSISAKYNTLSQLVDEGLVKVSDEKYMHNLKLVSCTELGEKVAEKLWEIHELLPYKECEASEYRRSTVYQNPVDGIDGDVHVLLVGPRVIDHGGSFECEGLALERAPADGVELPTLRLQELDLLLYRIHVRAGSGVPVVRYYRVARQADGRQGYGYGDNGQSVRRFHAGLMPL